LNFDLASSGFLSALPYLAMSILVFFSSFLADWFQVNKILTTTQVRRYFNCLSFLGQTVFMLLAAFLLHPTYSVVLLTIGVGIGAFTLSGFTVNHLDIAPNYASILFGISNSFGSIPGIVSPLLTGYIVTSQVKSATERAPTFKRKQYF
jgi:MFS transporter, ACS family, solute carrier family 17 (sodium-dependent inorganic phosphate cotransporter), other